MVDGSRQPNASRPGSGAAFSQKYASPWTLPDCVAIGTLVEN
jgi:hypothetical protein